MKWPSLQKVGDEEEDEAGDESVGKMMKFGLNVLKDKQLVKFWLNPGAFTASHFL